MLNTIWCPLDVCGPATEWLVAGGNLFLGLAATVTAVLAFLGIPEVRSWIFKPRIRPVEMGLVKVEHERRKKEDGSEQKRPIIYWRLIVKNIKWWRGRSAEDVSVLLTYDKCSPKNFIPIPLRWTYYDRFKRNISRGESAYLDVLEEVRNKNTSELEYYFKWARDVAGSGSAEGVIRKLDANFGDLRLEFFERNGGRIGDVKISNLMDERKFRVFSYG